MQASKTRILLTRQDAADALGISVDTLDRLLHRGELRLVHIGRSVLVPASEVRALVSRRLGAEQENGESRSGNEEARS